MKNAIIVFALCLGMLATKAHAACPPAGYDRARLEALQADQWRVASNRTRNALALAMVPCLADPDTAYRDGLAFDAFQHWMRADLLSHATLLRIGDELQGWLTAPEGQGFSRPFAALILAEAARTDRLHPWLTAERRQSLLDAAIAYFVNVRDYRGFDDAEGWRHGVAHGADLLTQLALNPAFGKPELTRIRDAVATQIAPAGHFYIYGESERLANPILYIAGRGLFTEAEWTEWLAHVGSPAPLASWNDAYTHNADLARVHDMREFFMTLYAVARLDQTTADDGLLPGVEAVLRTLP
jgi:hypothetical protein